ncbi:amidase [Microthyrium microscopicum]|uniref:Amidase n=1 Tax=Microthyrium microscopicum TaxID=703497 RepID=A0A6A6TZH1_9PEZI|nr:amidase [Microthyrium microscopicum]
MYAFPSLTNVTLEELNFGLEKGYFSSVDLVHAYQARIAEVNDTLHAVTELNPDALTIAAALDLERKNGKIRGPLHGIPIIIKNNIATADKMNNTAGSYALLGAKIKADSTIAAKLRAAGVVILGKSNLSQWANYRSNPSSNGWSAHGGQTKAAFYPDQDPCGSSSGSGVSSSIGLAFAALGTETDGSIVCPSHRNNLVGIKPTVGLTSRHGVIPISEHQDTVGPMARTVKDAATILQAIAGPDPQDNYTLVNPNAKSPPDYVAACKLGILKGARIGVPQNAITGSGGSPNDTEVIAFNKAIPILQSLGATVINPANFRNITYALNSPDETLVLNADFLVNLPAYVRLLVKNPSGVKDLATLRNITQHDPREEYPARNTKIWDEALAQWPNTDPKFKAAHDRAVNYALKDGLIGTLKRYKLDAVILPTNFASSWAATIGAPIVTVPLGFYPADAPVIKTTAGDLVGTAPGVPFGISFLGDLWSEEKLIGLAYAFEQKTQVQKQGKPYLVPTAELKGGNQFKL